MTCLNSASLTLTWLSEAESAFLTYQQLMIGFKTQAVGLCEALTHSFLMLSFLLVLVS